MKVSELWREEVEKRDHYSQYNKEEFVQILNTRCPDWKEQIRDEAVWPELHLYGANLNETLYLDVFLEELGLKFAYYLVAQQDKHFLASVCAADYCSKHIATHWAEFPDVVKNEMLKDRYLRAFLKACLDDASLWNSLSAEQKKKMLDKLENDEPRYVSDHLLFLMWSHDLNYGDSQFLFFDTEDFRRAVRDFRRREERDPHREEDIRMIEHQISRWDIPYVTTRQAAALAYRYGPIGYVPSRKLQLLTDVAEFAGDKESLAVLNRLQHELEQRFRHVEMMY
jgi:hypothetical protein